jgi:hypothetical protein
MILKKSYIGYLVNSILADAEMGINIKGKVVNYIIITVSPEKVMIANNDHKENNCKNTDDNQRRFPAVLYCIQFGNMLNSKGCYDKWFESKF